MIDSVLSVLGSPVKREYIAARCIYVCIFARDAICAAPEERERCEAAAPRV